MKTRRLIYYATWPFEAIAWAFSATAYVLKPVGDIFWKLIIVSNPLFLALYLMDREKKARRAKEDA